MSRAELETERKPPPHGLRAGALCCRGRSAAGRGAAAAVTAAVSIAAAEQDKDQNDDPAAIPTAEKAIVVTAHMRTS